MKLFAALLCLTLASASTPSLFGIEELRAQKAVERIRGEFKTQDYSILTNMCTGEGLAGFISNLIGTNPLLSQYAPALQALTGCLGQLCGVVNNACWTSLVTRLPTENHCVPGLATSQQILATACDGGCLQTLNTIAATTAQCIASWQTTNAVAITALSAFFQFNLDLRPLAGISDRLCTQNPADGSFCITKLLDTSLLVNPGNPSSAQNCPYYQSLGCCAPAMAGFFLAFNGSSGLCGGNTAAFSPATWQTILTTCNIGSTQTASCPLLGQVSQIGVVNWAISNINFDAWRDDLTAAQKLEFLNAIKADFAAATGIDAASISIGSITELANGIQAKIVLRGLTNDLTLDKFQQYVTYITNNANVPSLATVLNFLSSHASLTAGTGGDASVEKDQSSQAVETQSGGGGTSAASVASAGLWTTVVAVAVAAFVGRF